MCRGGLWVDLASPLVADLLAGAGFDWLLLDAEHGPNSLPQLLAQAQAIGSRCSPVVRLPAGEAWMIKQVLDLGIQSVMIPMVESGAQAAALARAMRYPPRGIRGMGASVARSGDFVGVGSYRLVGGAGGWGRTIPAKFYQSPGGLRMTPILSDAAKAVGETVELQRDFTFGQWFARREGPASTVLRQLANGRWWVRPDGVTEIGDVPEEPVASPFDVIRADLGVGLVEIATDRPEDWAPGVTFSSPTLSKKRAGTVVHRLTANAFRTQVWVVP